MRQEERSQHAEVIQVTKIAILLAAAVLLLGPPVARGAFPIRTEAGTDNAVLLSFTNHTDEQTAPDTIRSMVRRGIQARGIHCVPDSVLRPILRKYRIRVAGLGVGPENARRIGSEAEAGSLVLGSVDIWRGGDDPEVGISLRIVRIRDMRIVGAASVGAMGSDFTRVFGFGRVGRIEDLASRVVRKALEDLDGSTTPDPAEGRAGGKPRVALVTFDNLSTESHGGEIVTSILLSRMVQAGYDVLEPGVMNEIFLRSGENPRGEIDYALMRTLVDSTGERIFVTGAAQTLAPTTGSEGVPRFEFGARGIDGRSGRILFALERTADGRDSQTLLRLGRIRSLTRLVVRAIEPVIEAAGGHGAMEGQGRKRG